ncbi:hypothetical protein X740_17480 [Mesorhizobium sp. LNHC221B00]|nr:hypothetical protein X765_15195 [Mesorhizobium sp. LSHC440B00]ESX43330.1 hypothetical protein X764_08965 [Mesorhizobium sp. LSHC440A00]ESY79592.1 hypothetical protein X740_17480 [Mesorhizobium sp. LNHC221B00]ESZ23652.1 hypothetical protein X734_25205 [Mesorhizobium sp. L2C084A000]
MVADLDENDFVLVIEQPHLFGTQQRCTLM